ncbi:MAG: PQQ-binding-like beta-propeller repeat protein [Proteobacteria bacterium]|jgi:quinohemoprotein ethanol dehydrogenase|nr:PQQ-binding-like beta-propeller repeat protein [Pseudomonadota bacterium]
MFNNYKLRNVFTALVLVVPLIGPATAQSQETGVSPAFDSNTLMAHPDSNWLTNGGNLYNQRYSPRDRINRDNVSELKGVWHINLGSGLEQKYSGEAQPIVYEGVIYVVTGANDVFAVSVETGEHLWKYEANLESEINTVCCGWTSRGVGMGDGKIFVGQLDGKLLALDQTSGEVIWATQAERWQDGYSITSAPLYYNGLVITGFAGAEFATRGRVKAYDVSDGSLVWTFYTIPGPGEFGHDTWSQENEVWKFGGGTVWQTPAIDPELGMIYFSTGNPGPDFNGSVRPGNNLFTASVLALDVMTGEYRWHFQQVHHDLWDYDSATPVVLFDMEIDGQMRKAVVSTNKNAWAYILDRETGEPLLDIVETEVPQESRQLTALTQPIPVGDALAPQEVSIPPQGFQLVNNGRVYTPFWTESILVAPGPAGATNWPPSSYDPRSGALYVCVTDRDGAFTADELGEGMPEPENAGDFYTGGPFGHTPLPPSGIFAALDMHTNRLIWQQAWPDRCYSGSINTAGNLLFVGRNDGRLTAMDTENGNLLWEFQTGAGMNSTVSLFEHNGEDYVVAYAAGNVFAASPRGDNLWLFGLNGTVDESDPADSIITVAEPDHSGELPPSIEAGRIVYESTCQFCHGQNADGGQTAPALASDISATDIATVVQRGGTTMPKFEQILTTQQIRDVSAYVIDILME